MFGKTLLQRFYRSHGVKAQLRYTKKLHYSPVFEIYVNLGSSLSSNIYIYITFGKLYIFLACITVYEGEDHLFFLEFWII